MIYIDKSTFPHCYIEEKKFDWGEPYDDITPIFNLSIDPDLSDIEFTIEVLGKNNFKINLGKLYNILVNREENERIENCNISISNREFLLNNINTYLSANLNSTPPWNKHYGEDLENTYESLHLESIEESINRKLLLDRRDY
ncbi:hypothetical protein [Flavobacterium sp. JAS]|uniref:hypothetical protein n=1 Tax=Flavobacterium sp. JAS TaxID=2897329 RepID=UPI001E64826D|nr:hypothetical protein [Flavobacterium sp. JAS]MCD0468607.1 hypothetical protein [Flavobacterium sp. JAS]